jgi:hypothetical protein
MAVSNDVTASFDSARCATAAVDWFSNQKTPPGALRIAVAPKGGGTRHTQPGDNRRDDLTWFVTIDLRLAPVSKRVAVETMKREGGRIRPVPPVEAGSA